MDPVDDDGGPDYPEITENPDRRTNLSGWTYDDSDAEIDEELATKFKEEFPQVSYVEFNAFMLSPKRKFLAVRRALSDASDVRHHATRAAHVLELREASGALRALLKKDTCPLTLGGRVAALSVIEMVLLDVGAGGHGSISDEVLLDRAFVQQQRERVDAAIRDVTGNDVRLKVFGSAVTRVACGWIFERMEKLALEDFDVDEPNASKISRFISRYVEKKFNFPLYGLEPPTPEQVRDTFRKWQASH